MGGDRDGAYWCTGACGYWRVYVFVGAVGVLG